jgi:hypothetical protein
MLSGEDAEKFMAKTQQAQAWALYPLIEGNKQILGEREEEVSDLLQRSKP